MKEEEEEEEEGEGGGEREREKPPHSIATHFSINADTNSCGISAVQVAAGRWRWRSGFVNRPVIVVVVAAAAAAAVVCQLFLNCE